MAETVFRAGTVGEGLASAIEELLKGWPEAQEAAKVSLHMTYEQWNELLGLLRSARVEHVFDPST